MQDGGWQSNTKITSVHTILFPFYIGLGFCLHAKMAGVENIVDHSTNGPRKLSKMVGTIMKGCDVKRKLKKKKCEIGFNLFIL